MASQTVKKFSLLFLMFSFLSFLFATLETISLILDMRCVFYWAVNIDIWKHRIKVQLMFNNHWKRKNLLCRLYTYVILHDEYMDFVCFRSFSIIHRLVNVCLKLTGEIFSMILSDANNSDVDRKYVAKHTFLIIRLIVPGKYELVSYLWIWKMQKNTWIQIHIQI